MTNQQLPCYISIPDCPSSVGFVFICPGRQEETSGRPCAGQTGVGLEDGIVWLHQLDSILFPYHGRYQYLITNAWPNVEFVAKTGRSVPLAIEVATRQNIERLNAEIESLTHVVACGELAHLAVKLCVEFLGYQGSIAYVSHTSRQALGCPSKDRYPSVMGNWAQEVVRQISSQ